MNFAALRNKIMDLAICGKLLPQLEEEPAAEQIGDLSCTSRFAIPEKWKWVTLSAACSYIQRGKSPSYSDIQEIPVIAQKCNQWDGFHIEKAKFIDPKTITSYGEERKLQNFDVLWNSTGLGTLGRLAMYEETLNPYGVAVADSHVTVIRTNKKLLNPWFLYLYLKSSSVQSTIEDQASGSTNQKELAVTTIKNYSIPLAPIDEQDRIVKKVNMLLTEIDRAEKAYMELSGPLAERLRTTMLNDAIQGKLVPQLDNEPDVKQIGTILVNPPFDIPEKWKWIRLSEIVNFHLGGGTPSKQEPSFWGGTIPWASVKDLKTPILSSTLDTITQLGLDNSSANLIPKGNLIICTRMAVGKIITNEIDVAINQDLRAIFLKEDKVTKDFFKLVYPTLPFDRLKAGVTVKGIKIRDLLDTCYIALPPLEEQKRIVKKLESLLKQIDKFGY